MAGEPIRMEMTAQSRQTLRKLQRVDVLPDLRRELRAITQPMVSAARRAIRALPSSRTRRQAKEKGGSLRTAVARSVTRVMRVNARQVSVAIIVKPKGGKSNLARVLEGEIPWKHPTYGHDPEVTQPAEPAFYRTLEPMGSDAIKRIERVIDDLEKKLLCLS